jgi:hypothetical protein
MSYPLTQEEIDIYEKFISNKSPVKNSSLCIPSYGNREGRQIYTKIKKLTEPQYEVFYSEAMGFSSYALYKSPTNKIYIINTYNNVPQFYSIVRD